MLIWVCCVPLSPALPACLPSLKWPTCLPACSYTSFAYLLACLLLHLVCRALRACRIILLNQCALLACDMDGHRQDKQESTCGKAC